MESSFRMQQINCPKLVENAHFHGFVAIGPEFEIGVVISVSQQNEN